MNFCNCGAPLNGYSHQRLAACSALRPLTTFTEMMRLASFAHEDRTGRELAAVAAFFREHPTRASVQFWVQTEHDRLRHAPGISHRSGNRSVPGLSPETNDLLNANLDRHVSLFETMRDPAAQASRVQHSSEEATDE